jgi:hypothetical protein
MQTLIERFIKALPEAALAEKLNPLVDTPAIFISAVVDRHPDLAAEYASAGYADRTEIMLSVDEFVSGTNELLRKSFPWTKSVGTYIERHVKTKRSPSYLREVQTSTTERPVITEEDAWQAIGDLAVDTLRARLEPKRDIPSYLSGRL